MTVVLLTGVGRRGQLGETVARAFAERGATLLLVDRDPDQVRQRAEELMAAGHVAEAFACDLSDPAATEALARTIAERHDGRLDAAVLMAGGFAFSGPLSDSDPAELDRQLAINLRTAWCTARAVVPLLRPAGGSLVFFASEAVLPGSASAGMSAYAASKHAVVGVMRAVAAEERKHGVRANAVAPAAIRTARNVEEMGADAHFVEREAVADAVLFLCSPATRAISGQVIPLR
jgi:NAD(P)-dependent dehydrogenase (short-subunit alcohol dehydrogenase family)